jgi:uncharacterized coiled-coil DUF342 family protein
MMAETTNQVKRIHDKLQGLLRQFQALKKENEKLKGELRSAQVQVTGYQEHLETLKQQVDVLKLNASEMTEADKKEFEKRLNGYIKEIDRCIAMLGE